MSDIPSVKKINAQKHNKSNLHQKHYKARSTAKVEGGEHPKSKLTTAATSKLPSNWEKYEKNIEEPPEMPQVVGMDINMLSILPTSNSQFVLKQDKVFLPRNDSTLNPGEIFELDMNLISLSLATIPFYRKIGIDKSQLSNDEIQIWNRKALDANAVYHAYLSKQTNMPEHDAKKVDIASEEDYSNCDEVEIRTDELDLVEAAPVLTVKDLETKELEDWLNNVI